MGIIILRHRHTILVIDDSAVTIALFQAMLGEEYELLYASRGEQGIEMAMRMRPDLILLDVMMPGMDGYEVCRRLKRNRETMVIPVIFITFLEHEEDEEMGIEAGAIDFMTKPFHEAIMKAKLRNHFALLDLLRA
ncbi:response regulator [Paenibacillaceae bacterium]|nr:response regulator [Paenibacillaceae bacterium]